MILRFNDHVLYVEFDTSAILADSTDVILSIKLMSVNFFVLLLFLRLRRGAALSGRRDRGPFRGSGFRRVGEPCCE